MDNKHIDLLGEPCVSCGKGLYVGYVDWNNANLVLCLICSDVRGRMTSKSDILRSRRSEKPVED